MKEEEETKREEERLGRGDKGVEGRKISCSPSPISLILFRSKRGILRIHLKKHF